MICGHVWYVMVWYVGHRTCYVMVCLCGTVHVCYDDMWSPYMYVMAICGHRTCMLWYVTHGHVCYGMICGHRTCMLCTICGHRTCMLWRYVVTVHVCYGDMWSPYMYVMAICGHRTCMLWRYVVIVWHVCYGDMWSPYMYVMAICGHRTCMLWRYVVMYVMVICGHRTCMLW